MPSPSRGAVARMRALLRPAFDAPSGCVSDEDRVAILTLPRDELLEFLIGHAHCDVARPNALMLWYDEYDLNGWCRGCGACRGLSIGDVAREPRVWWLVLACGVLAAHPSVMTTGDPPVPSNVYNDCLERMEFAMRKAELLDRA